MHSAGGRKMLATYVAAILRCSILRRLSVLRGCPFGFRQSPCQHRTLFSPHTSALRPSTRLLACPWQQPGSAAAVSSLKAVRGLNLNLNPPLLATPIILPTRDSGNTFSEVIVLYSHENFLGDRSRVALGVRTAKAGASYGV